MNEKEREIHRLERMIDKRKNDLKDLQFDICIVHSNLSRNTIQEHIKATEKSIERLEFKLWKLQREEL